MARKNGISTTKDLTKRALAVAAYDHSFHPVVDYLDSLVWDGVNRLETWTIKYLGVEDTKLIQEIAKCWMISAVARIYEPGCQADHAVVLEGAQSYVRRGKSSALRVLAQPWFTDEIAELGTKDAAQQTVGRWIIELSEFESFTRADIARAKAFISRRVDRFRWSYDPDVREYPRQCVFAATVNDQDWGKDHTGDRRLWPMWCSYIDVDGLEVVRDQLWAEARDRYRAKENYHIHDVSLVMEAKKEQELRFLQDPREERIREKLDKRLESYLTKLECTPDELFVTPVSMQELLDLCEIPFNQHSSREQMRIAKILRRIGWVKKRAPKGMLSGIGDDDKRFWRCFPPGYDARTQQIVPESYFSPT